MGAGRWETGQCPGVVVDLSEDVDLVGGVGRCSLGKFDDGRVRFAIEAAERLVELDDGGMIDFAKRILVTSSKSRLFP